MNFREIFIDEQIINLELSICFTGWFKHPIRQYSSRIISTKFI